MSAGARGLAKESAMPTVRIIQTAYAGVSASSVSLSAPPRAGNLVVLFSDAYGGQTAACYADGIDFRRLEVSRTNGTPYVSLWLGVVKDGASATIYTSGWSTYNYNIAIEVATDGRWALPASEKSTADSPSFSSVPRGALVVAGVGSSATNPYNNRYFSAYSGIDFIHTPTHRVCIGVGVKRRPGPVSITTAGDSGNSCSAVLLPA